MIGEIVRIILPEYPTMGSLVLVFPNEAGSPPTQMEPYRTIWQNNNDFEYIGFIQASAIIRQISMENAPIGVGLVISEGTQIGDVCLVYFPKRKNSDD